MTAYPKKRMHSQQKISTYSTSSTTRQEKNKYQSHKVNTVSKKQSNREPKSLQRIT